MPKVAAIQMCSSHIVQENLETAACLIQEAAQHGAALIILPEMFAILGLNPSDKIKAKENFGFGKIQEFLATQAVKNNVWLVGGTIPISCQDGFKVRAACIVYDNTGKAVARYDKIHLFDVVISESEFYKESDSTEPGNEIIVIDTPVGKLGLAICFDIRFPNIFTEIAKKGAEIIAIPAAFTVKTGEAHWKVLTRSRAIDTFSYIIGACQGGTHAGGRKTYGHSLIVDPWGSIVDERLDLSPGVVYSEIDLANLYRIRKSIPIMDNKKDIPEQNPSCQHIIHGQVKL